MGEVNYYDVSGTVRKEKSPSACLAALLSLENGYKSIATRDLEKWEHSG